MNRKIQRSILIIGAGLEQKIAIDHAKSMGLTVIATDDNKDAIGLKYAHIGIKADTSNIKELVRIGKKYQVDGVMTHAVDIPVIISKVAKQLKLPHLDPKIADICTNKFKRLRCLKKAGLPVPKFGRARTISEALREARKISFPLVIKPVDNAGARGVKMILDLKGLKQSFNESLTYSKIKMVVLEEYLQGIEISTESFVDQDKIYTTGFADRNYSRFREFKPYFVEDGHSVPSVLPTTEQKQIVKEVEKAIKALGINFGVAKGDILVRNNRVYVLEMAPRTSGGWFAVGTVPIATGVNILTPLIKASLGEKIDKKYFQPKYNRAACQRYIIPTESGIFQRLKGIKKARYMPGVKMLDTFRVPIKGEKINRARNNSERYGQIITEGRDIKEATLRCEKAIKSIKIVLSK